MKLTATKLEDILVWKLWYRLPRPEKKATSRRRPDGRPRGGVELPKAPERPLSDAKVALIAATADHDEHDVKYELSRRLTAAAAKVTAPLTLRFSNGRSATRWSKLHRSWDRLRVTSLRTCFKTSSSY